MHISEMNDQVVSHLLGSLVKRILSVVSPNKVVLLGSAARGEMHENSDLDTLVIVPNGTHRRHTAQKIYRGLIGFQAAVDVIVVTEADVRNHRHNFGLVYCPALREGREICVSAWSEGRCFDWRVGL